MSFTLFTSFYARRVYVAALLVALVTPGVARAEDTPPAGGTVSVTASVEEQMAILSAQYQSATNAMLNVYANGVNGSTGSVTQAMIAMNVGTAKPMSFSTLMSSPVGIDAAVVAAGKTWAEELAKTRASMTLTVPEFTPEWSQAATSLGALTASATASMASIDPTAFMSLRAGTATASTKDLWSKALGAAGMKAVSSTSGGGCLAALMAAATSGSSKAAQAASSGCSGGTSSCIASGLYFYNQLQNIGSGGAGDPGVLPPADFNQLQPWQRDAIAKAAPSVTGSKTTTQGACGSAGAVSATTNVVVPKAWGALGGQPTTSNTVPDGWGALGR